MAVESTQSSSSLGQNASRFEAPFLVFEGLDGSGKSTLMKGVTEELKKQGRASVTTREPGGTPLAEEIRRLLLKTEGEAPVAPTELLLYAASRAQHVAQVIRPALERKTWVLCDRFAASTVAFQCFARGLARPEVDWLNRFAIQGVDPTLTILLDLSAEESQARRGGRAGDDDRMEREAMDFHRAVRRGYLEQAKENPEKWLVLDATASPEALQAQVIEQLKARQWL